MKIDDTKPRDIYLGMWVYVLSEEDKIEVAEFLRLLKEYTLRKCPASAHIISTEFIEKKAGKSNLKHDTIGIKMHFYGIWPYESLKSTGMYLGN